jgi:type I restriction enzyme, S subunit
MVSNMASVSRVAIPIANSSFKLFSAIAEILSDMDAEIAALEGKLSKAREVKQGMMSMLLTGKIRLVGGG